MSAEKIFARPYLLFDGAMGTYYEEVSGGSVRSCELSNIEAPEIIEKIHSEYINAGAKAIRTNTFAANTVSLNCEFSKVREIIKSAYDIAQRCCKDKNVLIFADIGPIPDQTETDREPEYKRIIDTFLNCGAKYFCFETFSEYEILVALSGYIKDKAPEAFILTQFAVTPDGYSRKGISGREILKNISAVKTIDAYGFNCISGPLHLFKYVKELNADYNRLSVMPNAGYPAVINERTVFSNKPEYFASAMSDIQSTGVKIIGGCCGTTPAHIFETAKKLGATGITINKSVNIPVISEKRSNIENNFFKKLSIGKKAIAVELDPPFDNNADYLIQGAKLLREAGADIITLADCPLARARADSSILSAKIKREALIDALPHMACRDRNFNATKALLLGLHIEGVRNMLAVTGDPIPETDRSGVKGVYSFNSYRLLSFVDELNNTVFEGDNIVAGAALNINAQNFPAELERAKKKMLCGARFFLTQSVFSDKSYENLKMAKETLDTKILGGILPIVSYRNAMFINSEVAGMDIPDDIIKLYEGRTKEEAEALAIELCLKTAERISGYTDGFYIMTPLKRYALTAEIVKRIKADI